MPIPPSMIKLIGIAVLSVPTLIIFSLVVASCISNTPGIRSIYLVSISSPNYTVRAGYFGVCAGPKNAISCPGLPQLASNSTSGNSTTSDFELLEMGLEARHKVFFPYFEAAAGLFFLAAMPLAVWTPFRIKTGTKWDKLVILLLGCACFLSFMATMACIPGRNGMSLTADRLKGDATVHAGLTMFILHWISFGFSFLLLIGFLVLSMPGLILGKLKSGAASRLGGAKGQSLEGTAGNFAMGVLRGSKGSTPSWTERISGRWTKYERSKPKPKPKPEPDAVDPRFVVGEA
ncbi:hypothetical protein BLS_003715 [Venturia inaequalis]|uniref:Uncharacterized protein n=1 Tax=Venturia inaequalis TaxID=5025 RepID=A0A8H3VED8_VENIN|nr:hypothetical protein BLS_003715 [Venturia inaequalis]KAE9986211.1 hypothetical protein EG327_004426 [Venturia inaequalis]RDI85860.1 hypothetical protein Vi05172_g4207 [Venturia inaequalis]